MAVCGSLVVRVGSAPFPAGPVLRDSTTTVWNIHIADCINGICEKAARMVRAPSFKLMRILEGNLRTAATVPADWLASCPKRCRLIYQASEAS